jgi:cellulose biosynthesis protein BcsQ
VRAVLLDDRRQDFVLLGGPGLLGDARLAALAAAPVVLIAVAADRIVVVVHDGSGRRLERPHRARAVGVRRRRAALEHRVGVSGMERGGRKGME